MTRADKILLAGLLLAHLLGEPVGETVGYSVRGDRRSSRRTRVEIVTTGLLLRRIQHDPELAGVGAAQVEREDAGLARVYALRVVRAGVVG